METQKISRLLPEMFQASIGRESPLDAFLEAQAALHAPCEDVLSKYPQYFDPRRAPLPFVYLLAHWVNLDYLLEGPAMAPHFPAGEGALRELICLVARNARERGAAQGIERMLSVATGLAGFKCGHADGAAFHVVVIAPVGAEKYRSTIEKIIAAEKPAFTQCDLIFSDQD